VILLFGNLPNGAWRETSAFEQQVIEAFAHDRGTLTYFCREVDRPSGLRSGPPSLAPETVRERRYAITELAATLRDNREESIMIATGAALHIALADFTLRAAGRWSARGKAIPHALAAMNPVLATQFTSAFATLFAIKDAVPVLTLVDSILALYGGRLRAGFRQAAPAAWRI
jgi:hypothetical protein